MSVTKNICCLLLVLILVVVALAGIPKHSTASALNNEAVALYLSSTKNLEMSVHLLKQAQSKSLNLIVRANLNFLLQVNIPDNRGRMRAESIPPMMELSMVHALFALDSTIVPAHAPLVLESLAAVAPEILDSTNMVMPPNYWSALELKLKHCDSHVWGGNSGNGADPQKHWSHVLCDYGLQVKFHFQQTGLFQDIDTAYVTVTVTDNDSEETVKKKILEGIGKGKNKNEGKFVSLSEVRFPSLCNFPMMESTATSNAATTSTMRLLGLTKRAMLGHLNLEVQGNEPKTWDLWYSASKQRDLMHNSSRKMLEFEEVFAASCLGDFNFFEVAVNHVLANAILGHVVEAGVFNGAMSIFMQTILSLHHQDDQHQDPQRKLYLVDSFQGVPRSTDFSRVAMPTDPTHNWPGGTYAVTQEQVRSNFVRFGVNTRNVEFVPGFFNETIHNQMGASIVPGGGKEPIALLRIDADSFQGTMDALQGLYGQMVEGGIVVVDDYHLAGCRAAVLMFREINHVTSPLLPVPLDYIFGCPGFTTEVRRQKFKEDLLAGRIIREKVCVSGESDNNDGGAGGQTCNHLKNPMKMYFGLPPQSVFWEVGGFNGV